MNITALIVPTKLDSATVVGSDRCSLLSTLRPIFQRTGQKSVDVFLSSTTAGIEEDKPSLRIDIPEPAYSIAEVRVMDCSSDEEHIEKENAKLFDDALMSASINLSK